MKNYFYSLLVKYLSLFILSDDSVLLVNPVNDRLLRKFKLVKQYVTSDESGGAGPVPEKGESHYIVLNGSVHYEKDIHDLLNKVHGLCSLNTRVVITYYSALWRPLIRLATFLKFRSRSSEMNWIAPEDLENFLLLADFEEVRTESRILVPLYIPIVSNLINKFLAPLPLFNLFNMVNISISRPRGHGPVFDQRPSVSIVVAARNEEGNIENLVKRLPAMGPDDELIFVEGQSKDNTWGKIQEIAAAYSTSKNIVIAQQTGKGKGDAVRKGFSLATKEILMILDADLTVPPEDLPQFYEAIVSGKGEYINGSRLVYPLEKHAMRFFNILGNKFFALAFSFVLGQRFKDTLCGTKVISRENYIKLAAHRAYFGDFDPFGDFDLIFGSARLALKIVEVPIAYRERTYGDTNISRWSHGALLLRMLIFASRKFKFI